MCVNERMWAFPQMDFRAHVSALKSASSPSLPLLSLLPDTDTVYDDEIVIMLHVAWLKGLTSISKMISLRTLCTTVVCINFSEFPSLTTTYCIQLEVRNKGALPFLSHVFINGCCYIRISASFPQLHMTQKPPAEALFTQ